MNIKQGASVVRTDKRNRKKSQQKTELQCRSLIDKLKHLQASYFIGFFYLSSSSLFVWGFFVVFFLLVFVFFFFCIAML